MVSENNADSSSVLVREVPPRRQLDHTRRRSPDKPQGRGLQMRADTPAHPGTIFSTVDPEYRGPGQALARGKGLHVCTPDHDIGHDG